MFADVVGGHHVGDGHELVASHTFMQEAAGQLQPGLVGRAEPENDEGDLEARLALVAAGLLLLKDG